MGRAEAMLNGTWTSTLSAIEDSIGPGAVDEIDICASVGMGRLGRRRKDDRETEQILTNMEKRNCPKAVDHIDIDAHHPSPSSPLSR